jgi:hypothetical protein
MADETGRRGMRCGAAARLFSCRRLLRSNAPEARRQIGGVLIQNAEKPDDRGLACDDRMRIAHPETGVLLSAGSKFKKLTFMGGIDD